MQPLIRTGRDSRGKLTIVNVLPMRPPPAVYLDGAPLQSPMLNGTGDLSMLDGLRTEDIDYIEVNIMGLGEGLNGAGGVIRIFTRGYYFNEPKKPYEYSEFDYPLTFDRPDDYAVPLYSSYTNDAYLKYGVVGWFPNLAVGNGGEVKFTVPSRQLEGLRLNIQGFSNKGDLFSETLSVQIDE